MSAPDRKGAIVLTELVNAAFEMLAVTDSYHNDTGHEVEGASMFGTCDPICAAREPLREALAHFLPSPATTTPPPTPAAEQISSHPAGAVPFVAGRVSATVEELCGEGFDDYSPLPPGGSH